MRQLDGSTKGKEEAMSTAANHTDVQRSVDGQLGVVRRASFGLLVMLIVQVELGIAISVYASSPKAQTPGGGIFSALGRALSNGPASLSLHVVLGVLLLAGSAALVVRTILSRSMFFVVTSTAGLVAVSGEFSQGAEFANAGHDSSSMAMAIFAGVAMLCYGGNLFAMGGKTEPRDLHRTGREVSSSALRARRPRRRMRSADSVGGPPIRGGSSPRRPPSAMHMERDAVLRQQ
jgi:hypothetical protein